MNTVKKSHFGSSPPEQRNTAEVLFLMSFFSGKLLPVILSQSFLPCRDEREINLKRSYWESVLPRSAGCVAGSQLLLPLDSVPQYHLPPESQTPVDPCTPHLMENPDLRATLGIQLEGKMAWE